MRERGGSPAPWRAGVDAGTRRRGALGAALLVALIVGSLAVIASREGDEVGPELAEAAPSPDPPGTELPTPEVPVDPSPAGDVQPAVREPTPADAAAFAAQRRPGGADDAEAVTVDLDADGRQDVIAVAVVAGGAELEVGSWDGEAYRVVFADRVAPADAVTRFEVVDVTGDGRREILVALTAAERARLALWGLGADGVERQLARGGCWDGSHVVGSRGAEVVDGVLTATCDPDLAPGGDAIYTWDGQRWTYEGTEAA